MHNEDLSPLRFCILIYLVRTITTATHRALGARGADDRSSPIGVICDGGRGRVLLSDSDSERASGGAAALLLAGVGRLASSGCVERCRGMLTLALRAFRVSGARRARVPNRWLEPLAWFQPGTFAGSTQLFLAPTIGRDHPVRRSAVQASP